MLTAVNAVVFAAIWATGLPAADTGLSADAATIMHRPWTPVTYMFVHYSFWHMTANMLWLWIFGRILEGESSWRRVLGIYMAGGLAGAACYLLSAQWFAVGGTLCGASAAVVAVMAAAATLAPDMTLRLLIFGNVKLKWVVAAAVALIFIGTGGGGFGAHLGGLAAGVATIFAGRKRNAPRPESRSHKPSRRLVRRMARNLERRRSDMARLDALLDQVRLSGFESLSRTEKAELQRLSKALSINPQQEKS